MDTHKGISHRIENVWMQADDRSRHHRRRLHYQLNNIGNARITKRPVFIAYVQVYVMASQCHRHIYAADSLCAFAHNFQTSFYC